MRESCRLALQQQRAAGGTKLAERGTTNERLARRQEALRTQFASDPNDSGGVFLTAEDAEQMRQRSPIAASPAKPEQQPAAAVAAGTRRRFEAGGSNADAVAQIREARRARAAGLAPAAAAEVEESGGDGGTKLTQRAKMLQEQRQQVPLTERRTTNAEAAQREAMRRDAYTRFAEDGGGSIFMSDGAVPVELIEARRQAEEKENEQKQRRRAALATFSADDAHVFMHDHNVPEAMTKLVAGGPPRARADSEPVGVTAPAAYSGEPRQRLRRRLASTASSAGTAASGGSSIAERARAMRLARGQRGGSDPNLLPPPALAAQPPASPVATGRTMSSPDSPALAHAEAMKL